MADVERLVLDPAGSALVVIDLQQGILRRPRLGRTPRTADVLAVSA